MGKRWLNFTSPTFIFLFVACTEMENEIQLLTLLMRGAQKLNTCFLMLVEETSQVRLLLYERWFTDGLLQSEVWIELVIPSKAFKLSDLL